MKANKLKPVINIIAETNDWVVINKPPLLDSQNSKPNLPSVVSWLEEHYGFKGLVHRLDFMTSGLMVCAKNSSAAEKLTQLMQKNKILRKYYAVCIGVLADDQGEIALAITEQNALTHYKVLKRYNNATWVEVTLATGRKHQIRKHFLAIGHPLLGDHLYKKKGSDKLFNRPALHAFELTIGDAVYNCAMPLDLKELLARLPSNI